MNIDEVKCEDEEDAHSPVFSFVFVCRCGARVAWTLARVVVSRGELEEETGCGCTVYNNLCLLNRLAIVATNVCVDEIVTC